MERKCIMGEHCIGKKMYHGRTLYWKENVSWENIILERKCIMGEHYIGKKMYHGRTLYWKENVSWVNIILERKYKEACDVHTKLLLLTGDFKVVLHY